MRLRGPTPISPLLVVPPARRDLASDTRTPHLRSSSTSCCSPFSTLLSCFQSSLHLSPLFLLPKLPAFHRSYTFTRHSIPGPIIVLVSFFPEDQPVCHVPGPSLLPSVAHFSLPIGQPSSDAQRLHLYINIEEESRCQRLACPSNAYHCQCPFQYGAGFAFSESLSALPSDVLRSPHEDVPLPKSRALLHPTLRIMDDTACRAMKISQHPPIRLFSTCPAT